LISTQTNVSEFVKKSMSAHENDLEKGGTSDKIALLQSKMAMIKPKCSAHEVEEYDRLTECIKTSVNKKRKNFQKELALIEPPDTNTREYYSLEKQLITHQENLCAHEKFVEETVVRTMNLLRERGFVEDSENVPQLTKMGVVASQINEVDSLIMAKLIMNGTLNDLSIKQLVGVFSCFTDKSDDAAPPNVPCILEISKDIESYFDTGFPCKGLSYELFDHVMAWCDCETEEECKWLLQNTGIFLGDFVKALLKIVNIAREVEKVASYLNSPLVEAVSNIPNALLKYVATNQTLYI
jgi:superfamily II RNA helicase